MNLEEIRKEISRESLKIAEDFLNAVKAYLEKNINF